MKSSRQFLGDTLLIFPFKYGLEFLYRSCVFRFVLNPMLPDFVSISRKSVHGVCLKSSSHKNDSIEINLETILLD